MSIARGAAFRAALCISLALFATALLAALPGARAWAGGAPGGVSTYVPETSPEPSAPSAPAGKAVISRGRALAPLDAPAAVRRVIVAANKIRAKPYIWGGGHGRWWDAGYDCSGAVSFALHGGEFLSSPLPSGPMEQWGSPGPGRWITVYANAGHAFAVIAGLRWDTVGDSSGTGPRWHDSTVSTRGFVARHPEGY
jgi:cell wall-associated NlpC family hydrolase